MSQKSSPLLCRVCDRKFSNKTNLLRHLSSVHKIDRPVKKHGALRLLCPFEDCQEQFLRHPQFVGHLKEKHSFEPTVEELTFTSEDDFLNWKYDLQKKSLVEYTKENSTKTLSDGSRKVYLTCHRLQRSNQTLKNAKDRKRALKSQGSKKTTRSCPSRIEVVYNKDLTLSVKHWKDHCGHTNDLGHCSLVKSTKDDIASRLQDGVSFQHIMDGIRSEGLYDDPRTLLLNRKDLHNVVRDYKIAYQTKRHREDGISVNSWHEEMTELGEEMTELGEDMNVGNTEKLAHKARLIIDLLSKANLNDLNSNLVETKLDGVIGLLNNMLHTRKETNSERENRQNRINLNRKIKPQESLFSSKKKGNNSSKSLKKPNFNESVSIIEGLVSETQIVNILHTKNDHTYNM